jgi:hypothetical protein
MKIDVAEAITNAEKDIIDILEDLKQTLGVQISTRTGRIRTGHILSQDKAKMVQLFEKGYSTHQITERFPQYTVMQVSAIKAHITMGTY